MNKDLQLVVGIEMHCELKSHAKAFSKGINGFSDTANVYVSPPIVLSIKRGVSAVVGEPSNFIIFPFSCDFI